jgi:hypothetical protein
LIEHVNASEKNVRNFGYLFGGICALGTVFFLYKGNSAWMWTAGGVLFFIATAFVGYPLLKPLYIGWMLFAFVLGWFNTRLLLGLFFYLVLSPIGLGLRLAGKDLLGRKIDRNAKSYWIRRERKQLDPKRYERLF